MSAKKMEFFASPRTTAICKYTVESGVGLRQANPDSNNNSMILISNEVINLKK